MKKLPVIGVMEVPKNMVSRYGIIQGEEFAPGMFRVRDLVEKAQSGRRSVPLRHCGTLRADPGDFRAP